MTNPYRPLSPFSAALINDEVARRAMQAFLEGSVSRQGTWAVITSRANALSETGPVAYFDLFRSTQDLADHCRNSDSERLPKKGRRPG